METRVWMDTAAGIKILLYFSVISMATPTMIKIISNICEAKFGAGHCSKGPDYINSGTTISQSHFTDEEAEARGGSSDFLKVTWLVTGSWDLKFT